MFAMIGRPEATEPPAVFFRYRPDRKGERPRAAPGVFRRRAAGGRVRWVRSTLRRADKGGGLLGARTP